MIYLDHHAATPVSPAARRAMDEVRDQAWANPASVHRAGQKARSILEGARNQVAAALGGAAADIVFTAGGTEACNLGIWGLLPSTEGKPRVVTTEAEHPAVLASAQAAARCGAEILYLPVTGGRLPAPEQVRERVNERTVVAVQWVNHETGTINPIEPYAEVCAEAGARFFVDATQAFGRIPVQAYEGVHAMAVASHKIGGPAGAGALWVNRTTDLAPRLHGGAQERGRRPGSPDVVHIAGFGAACAALPERLASMPHVARLRDRLEAFLKQHEAIVNGTGKPSEALARVASVTNVSVRGRKGPVLVMALDLEGVCASSGSACSSGLSEPSRVLRAMYPDEPWRAESALRMSLGPELSDADIDAAIGALERVLARNA